MFNRFQAAPVYRYTPTDPQTKRNTPQTVFVFDTCSILKPEFSRLFLSLSASLRNGTFRIVIPHAVISELAYISGAASKTPATAAAAAGALELIRSAAGSGLIDAYGSPSEVVSGDWAILGYCCTHFDERTTFCTEDRTLQEDLRALSSLHSISVGFEVLDLQTLARRVAPANVPQPSFAPQHSIHSILRRLGIGIGTDSSDHDAARFA